MRELLSLSTLLVVALSLGSTAVSANVVKPLTKRDCSSKVDISSQPLPFLDYPRWQQAAEEAVAVLSGKKAEPTSGDSTSALSCDRIRVRKEWRQLTREEQKAYTLADKCLMKNPDYGLVANRTDTVYWDSLTNAHAVGFTRFHAGPKFLPFHRWFVWIHGYSLEKLCGYTGPIPYWDYTKDAGPDFYQSEIFSTDPDVGFGDGGSVPINEIGGRAGGFIVDNGAYANTRPGLPIPHYLVRNFTPDAQYNPNNQFGIGLAYTYNETARKRVLAAKDFWDFETKIDGLDEPQTRSLHNSIHFAIGGDAQSFNWLEGSGYQSQVFGANDPIFYLHHANVDHVYWTWQQGGNDKQFGYFGRQNSSDNFCDHLPFQNLGPDIPVALALKTEWYPQCYTYAQ